MVEHFSLQCPYSLDIYLFVYNREHRFWIGIGHRRQRQRCQPIGGVGRFTCDKRARS